MNRSPTTLIAAVAENGVIGKGLGMVWHQPADLKYFKKITLGYSIIMGSKTFDSFKGRMLPNRPHIVLTRKENHDYPMDKENLFICHSLEEAIELASKLTPERIFIIGGGQVYREALEKGYVDEVRLTHIVTEVDGDIYFPIDAMDNFKEMESRPFYADKKNQFDMHFKIYE